MPRAKVDTVLAGVEQDLRDLPERPGTAALRAMARTAARVIDGDGPLAPRVAALKTLEGVLAQLRGVPVRGGDDGELADLKHSRARRRGAVS